MSIATTLLSTCLNRAALYFSNYNCSEMVTNQKENVNVEHVKLLFFLEELQTYACILIKRSKYIPVTNASAVTKARYLRKYNVLLILELKKCTGGGIGWYLQATWP